MRLQKDCRVVGCFLQQAVKALMIPVLLSLKVVAESNTNADALKLSGVFGDNMVLQREKPVPVWGWADPGEKVTIRFAEQTLAATTDPSGKWLATFAPMVASDSPRELSVYTSKGTTRKIVNVLVGDVFVLGGQSNMTWWLSSSDGGEEAAKRADYPWLREFKVGYQLPDQPACDVAASSAWVVCDPEKAKQFPGAVFFFAELLHQRTRAPIALVQTAVAATWGENWISRAAMEANPNLRYSLDSYEKALQELPEKQKEWEQEKAKHEKAVAEAKAAGKTPPPPSYLVQNGPMGPKHPARPNALYNGRVAPLMPMAARAVFWYQGEGNGQIHLAEHYYDLLGTLVKSWRDGFAQGDLPFVIVQLPRYTYDHPWASWPLVREAQLKVSMEQPNCGLLTLIDQGKGTDIHPPNKLPVGQRLERLTRALVFNEKIVAMGPLLERFEIKGDAVLLRFRHVGQGLQRKNGALYPFTLCGKEKVFLPAKAEIIAPDTIRVTSPTIKQPLAARYAWAPDPDGNLFNSEGLPASPFRTDHFDVGHYLPLQPYLSKQRQQTVVVKPQEVLSFKEGRFHLDGKPLAELSFNKHDLIWNLWRETFAGRKLADDNPAVKAEDDDLAELAKMGVRTIRVFGLPWGGFNAGAAAFYYDPGRVEDCFYAPVDKALELCSRHGLKVIYSLLVSDFTDAPVPGGIPAAEFEQRRELIADPVSRSRKQLNDYLEEFISRYRTNKAIAMWELGNEITLWADIGSDGSFNGERMPTFADVSRFSIEVARQIKQLDPLRLVNNGGSYLRESQWNLYYKKNWNLDTLAEQYRCYEMLFKNSPIDVVDIHYYANNRKGFRIKANDGTAMELDLMGYQAFARQLGKPLILGEIAVLPIPRKDANGKPAPAYSQTPDYFESVNEVDAYKKYVQKAIDHIVEANVQLSYWWSYEGFSRQAAGTSDLQFAEWNKRKREVLAIIQDGNRRLKAKGGTP